MSSTPKSRRRTVKRVIVWLLSPVALVAILALVWFPLSKLSILPPFLRTAGFKPLQTPDTREARWQQDLDYYARELPRLHYDLHHATDAAAWDAAVADLREAIPHLTDAEIVTRFMALTALAGDGHTTVGLRALYAEPFNFRTYPVGVKWYEDGWHIIGGLPEYKELFGARLVAIDGTPADEAFAAVSAAVSHDNPMQLRQVAATVLMTPEVLGALGFVEQVEQADFTVETPAGEQTVAMPAVRFEALQDAVTVDEFFGEDEVPLARRNREDWYWYEYLPETQTVYFQYDVCGNMDGLPFRKFNEGMFEFVDGSDVERIVVDLRYNGGGNSTVLGPFLRELAARPELEVYTLIGRQTFSSALINAIQLSEMGATLVGEPTGGRPNHYGEVRPFRLPNSGLPIYYATRYFREMEDGDPPSLEPDVPVRITIADQLAGVDAALEVALSRQDQP